MITALLKALHTHTQNNGGKEGGGRNHEERPAKGHVS